MASFWPVYGKVHCFVSVIFPNENSYESKNEICTRCRGPLCTSHPGDLKWNLWVSMLYITRSPKVLTLWEFCPWWFWLLPLWCSLAALCPGFFPFEGMSMGLHPLSSDKAHQRSFMFPPYVNKEPEGAELGISHSGMSGNNEISCAYQITEYIFHFRWWNEKNLIFIIESKHFLRNILVPSVGRILAFAFSWLKTPFTEWFAVVWNGLE